MATATDARPAPPPRGARPRPAGLVLPAVGALPISAPLAYAGAVLSGLLYWLAFAGMDVWPLAFVAWVPLVVAMHRQSVRRATLLGWVAGGTMNVAGFFWLQQMLQTFSGFPAPVCFLFVLVVCAYQGGRIGLLGWLYGRASARGWPPMLVFAAAFVASELVYPLLFPWYYAATVHQVPLLTQLAEVGGPILVGLVLVAANLAIAELVVARLERRKPVIGTLAAGVVTVAFACAYGALRIGAVDAMAQAAPPAKVGVVQANMGLMEKRSSFDEGLQRHLTKSLELEKNDGVDFVVWSETSAMRAVGDDSYRQQLRAGVARRIGVPAIFGAVIIKDVRDERGYVLYNTAVSSDAAGNVTSRYDKQYLLTFGEYLPFGESFPVLYKWSPNSGHFTPGTSLDPLLVPVAARSQDGDPLPAPDSPGAVAPPPTPGTPGAMAPAPSSPGATAPAPSSPGATAPAPSSPGATAPETHRVTPLICYEDILPRFTNDAVRHADPELLVNMTNDAWFGDTTEPWEHLALAQFRAVEHRRFLVRGTNSGVSAVVDPVGRVVKHTSTFKEETLAATIHWMHPHTVYERIGDWPWLLVSVALVVGAFRRRFPAGAASPPDASAAPTPAV